MTTRYQCKGCQLVFDGFDPIRFGDWPDLLYPPCPNQLLEKDDPSKGLEDLAEQYEAMDKRHPVALAVVVAVENKPKPPEKPEPKTGAALWASFKPKEETEQETLQRLAKERLYKLQQLREQAEKDAQSKAFQLVNRMALAINRGDGKVSSNFPKDLQYGMKGNGDPYTASVDTIARAAVLWKAKGSDYTYRAPKFKKVWGVSMANFERLQASGKPDQGKHNFHVVPS